MDRKVTAWFYRFTYPSGRNGPSLEDVLAAAEGLGAPEARERNVGPEVGDDVIMRLERLSTNKDFVWGQFTRVQTIGIPPEANAKGLTPLKLSEEDAGLGYTVAFRYHKASKVMAIQFNLQAVSANRIGVYLSEIDSKAAFEVARLAREDSWARYGQGAPDKLMITIAAPENLEEVEPELDGFDAGIKALAEMAGAPMLNVELSMGHRNGQLDKPGVKEMIQKLLTKRKDGSADIRKLQVRAENDEHRDGFEVIDFLNPLLDEKGEISYKGNDPAVIYTSVEKWLEKAFSNNLAYIQKTYVKKNA